MYAKDDLGKLILRLTLGILIILHGIAKISSGPGFVMGQLSNAGLPAQIGYLVYVGELIAPALLIAGVWTRLAALVIVGNMLFAVWLVHMGDLASLSKTGGWALELQGMFLFTALALVFLGAGRYSMGGSGGRFN